METLGFLIKGLVIGLAIAAPVGPIGVLCIRRTLADGRLAGLVTGLGAATADGVCGAVAAFGLTVVTDLLIGNGAWLGIAGGVFLCFLGAKTFFTEPPEDTAPLTGGALAGLYGSTFVLTLTNPTTILSFVAIFAGLGLGDTDGDYGGAMVLVIGVFVGSALWWLGLSGAVSLLHQRMDGRGMRMINRVSGAVITAFGIGALVSAAAASF